MFCSYLQKDHNNLFFKKKICVCYWICYDQGVGSDSPIKLGSAT